MGEPLVTNAANAEQVKKAGKKVTRTRDTELEDVRFILSSKQGRRFYWNLLASCRVFQLSYTGSADTNFNEGMRNVGIKYLADMNDAKPEAYVTMLNESKEES